MSKIQIFQKNRINSLQYEISDEFIEVEDKREGATTKSKNELKSIGYIISTTKEVDVRERIFTDRDNGIMMTLFLFGIFSPMFIAGSNNIRILDFIAALVFIMAIVVAVYFIISSSTNKVHKKYIYMSEGGSLIFYYRTEKEIDEVEKFINELNKKIKNIKEL